MRYPIFLVPTVPTDGSPNYRKIVTAQSPETPISSSHLSAPSSTFSDLPPLMQIDPLRAELLIGFKNLPIGTISQRSLKTQVYLLRQELSLSTIFLGHS